jgi:hypothetical protein
MNQPQLESTHFSGAYGIEAPLAKFEPGGILPSQYYAASMRSNCMQGERKLMFAVLADAVHCYLKGINANSRRQRIRFYEVQDWINSTQENGPFAFAVLCDEFGIDSGAMREALLLRKAFAKRCESGNVEQEKGAQGTAVPAAGAKSVRAAVGRGNCL